MAGDVVGTAFVRIKALTSNLAKDIESNVKKGFKDANIDKIAESEGAAHGGIYGENFADSARASINKKSKDIIPTDDLLGDFKSTFKEVQDSFDDFRVPQFELDEINRNLHRDLNTSRVEFDRLGDDIDNGSLGKSLDNLSKRFKNLGGDSDFGLGILKNKMVLIGGAIAGALPFIQDIGSAILAYATGLVAQIGFVVTALGGLGVAAAAALGSAAVAFIPILLAFKAETEFLEHFKESLAETGQEFLRIGSATQQTLLPALDQSLGILERLIPMFSEFGLFVGRAVGQFSLLAANTLTGNVAQGRFQAILRSSLRILDILLPTLLNIGDILSGIWMAALPAAERFTGIISGLVIKWRDMVTVGLKTGELTNTFDEWFERARVLGSALGNLTGALFDILQVGADSSDNVFTRFDEWAKRFRDFTSSEAGQNRFKTIFDNALAVMREINGVAADLFDGIFGRLTQVGGVDSMVAALQKFRDVLPAIQEEWAKMYTAIKAVVDLVAGNIFDKVSRAVDKLAEPLGRLADQFFNLLETMSKSGAFDVFLDLMVILTDVLSTLLAIPGFAQFIAYFIAFGSAIKVASIVLGPFISAFGGFMSLMINLIKLKVGAELATTATGLRGLIAGFQAAKAAKVASIGAGVAQASAAAGEGAASLSGSIGGAVAGLGAFAPALAVAAGALAIGGAAFFIHQQKVQRWHQEIRQATDALGLLNDGLNITAEGVAKYIDESSRFETHDQIDDLVRLGFTVDELGDQVARGALTYSEFADAALRAGDVFVSVGRGHGEVTFDKSITSIEKLGETYSLTADQLKTLARDLTVINDLGQRISLTGNASLIESFKELNEVIGAAAKESIDEFATNATNIRLLNADTLVDIKHQIDDASDEEAAGIMADAQDQLAEAAKKSSAEIKGLSDATREQIHEQSRLADGTVDVVKENQLLIDASKRLSEQIITDLDRFSSVDFAIKFGDARDAVFEFSNAVAAAAASGAQFEIGDGVDEMIQKFPELADATQGLFDQLKTLPEAEFNAAATALGADADVLREAMNGAQQAILDLENQALASLPSVGSLLQDATETTDDGSEIFHRDAFVQSIKDRTQDTTDFASNIKTIKEKLGDDAARLAAQEGPEAAKNLVTVAGSNPDQVTAALAAMEAAEESLTTQIRDVLGPGISLEYAHQAGLISNKFSTTLTNGLKSPATQTAIQTAGVETLNEISEVFQGHFEWIAGELSFVPGKRASSALRKKIAHAGEPGFRFSEGGFVGAARFGIPFTSGPKGTDTVPSWLTPGEFVLRQSVAKAIPAGVLNSLNAGDPRLLGLLTSLSKNRPGSPAALAVSSGGAVVGQTSRGDLVIQQMNIEAPTPLESSRQVASRLRILQSQLTLR